MTLIVVRHAHKLRSAAEAEALFRALGERTVTLKGMKTSDAARYDRVIDAVVTKHDHTISFEGGSLANARPALDALVLAGAFGYVDVRTRDANLRIWPGGNTWVHSRLGLDDAIRAWGAPLLPGENVLGDTRIKLATEPTTGWPIDLDTQTTATALRMFHALSGDACDRGFTMRMTEPCKPLLRAFLHALGGAVDAVLDVDLATARALTELFPGVDLEWQRGESVRFPDGEITSYLVTPKAGERDQTKARKRIDKALARAKL